MWFAKSALMRSPVGGFLKMIPRWAWIALAVVIAVIGLVLFHNHKVNQFERDTRTDERAKVDAEWTARMDAMRKKAEGVRNRAEALARDINKDIGGRNEQEARLIVSRADALRVRGPGAARCRPDNHSSVPIAAGQHEPASGGPNVAGSSVPSDDRAAVPWPWLVERAQQCDLNRSEVMSWREWQTRQSELNERTRNQTAH